MSETKKVTRDPQTVPDFRAVNPRYQGAMASDVVRALVKPKVRDKLAERWEKKG